jgi:ElaB/YqjD/DUF883 family membrane-anchored ribosome-binding protein
MVAGVLFGGGGGCLVDTQTVDSSLKDPGKEAESGKLRAVANKTADGLARVADYTRSHDMSAVWGDITAVVRRRPVESIAVAVVLGVMVGRSMKRDY